MYNLHFVYSNAAYHGDFLKKAEMEQRRNLTNGNNVTNQNVSPPSNIINLFHLIHL